MSKKSKKENSIDVRVARWKKSIEIGREKNKDVDFERHTMDKMSQPSNYECATRKKQKSSNSTRH